MKSTRRNQNFKFLSLKQFTVDTAIENSDLLDTWWLVLLIFDRKRK